MNVHAALNSKYVGYADYKDSGVEWLGAVPSHWTVTAVKRFASFTIGWTPPTGIDAYFGGDHLWANISDIGPKVLYSTTKTITDAGVRATRIHKSPKGSLLFSFKLSIGQVSIVGEDMYTNEAIATFKPSETVYVPFMYWAAPLFIPQNAEENIYGAKLLNQERIGNACFVLPSPIEQRTIAAFLDYETARIDSLIDKQQRLIELLKEKRQAVISHAVTKGLNPDAPMKDSGVEWLGQVPEHWVVKSYRYACKIYRGKFGHRPRNDPDFYDGEYPFIQTGDVARAGKFITSYSQTLNEKGKTVSQLFPVGTLMMAIAANVGDTAILGFEAYAPDSVVGFKPRENIELEFLRYSFMAALPALEQTSTQSTQANLNVDRIGAVKAVFPPLEQQVGIVEYLDKVLERYDLVEKECLNGISLLQERRTALISAAVTGKIDLRGWTPPREG